MSRNIHLQTNNMAPHKTPKVSSSTSYEDLPDYTTQPCKCSLCPEVLVGVFRLNKHLARVHKARIEMVCKVCGEKFRRNKAMVQHLRERHMGQQQQSVDQDGLEKAPSGDKEREEDLSSAEEPSKIPVANDEDNDGFKSDHAESVWDADDFSPPPSPSMETGLEEDTIETSASSARIVVTGNSTEIPLCTETRAPQRILAGAVTRSSVKGLAIPSYSNEKTSVSNMRNFKNVINDGTRSKAKAGSSLYLGTSVDIDLEAKRKQDLLARQRVKQSAALKPLDDTAPNYTSSVIRLTPTASESQNVYGNKPDNLPVALTEFSLIPGVSYALESVTDAEESSGLLLTLQEYVENPLSFHNYNKPANDEANKSSKSRKRKWKQVSSTLQSQARANSKAKALEVSEQTISIEKLKACIASVENFYDDEEPCSAFEKRTIGGDEFHQFIIYRVCKISGGVYYCSVCAESSVTELDAKNHFIQAHSKIFRNERSNNPCIIRFANIQEFVSYQKRLRGKEILVALARSCRKTSTVVCEALSGDEGKEDSRLAQDSFDVPGTTSCEENDSEPELKDCASDDDVAFSPATSVPSSPMEPGSKFERLSIGRDEFHRLIMYKVCKIKDGVYYCSVCEITSVTELAAKNHFVQAHSDIFENRCSDSPCVFKFANIHELVSYQQKFKGKEILLGLDTSCRKTSATVNQVLPRAKGKSQEKSRLAPDSFDIPGTTSSEENASESELKDCSWDDDVASSPAPCSLPMETELEIPACDTLTSSDSVGKDKLTRRKTGIVVNEASLIDKGKEQDASLRQNSSRNVSATTSTEEHVSESHHDDNLWDGNDDDIPPHASSSPLTTKEKQPCDTSATSGSVVPQNSITNELQIPPCTERKASTPRILEHKKVINSGLTSHPTKATASSNYLAGFKPGGNSLVSPKLAPSTSECETGNAPRTDLSEVVDLTHSTLPQTQIGPEINPSGTKPGENHRKGKRKQVLSIRSETFVSSETRTKVSKETLPSESKLVGSDFNSAGNMFKSNATVRGFDNNSSHESDESNPVFVYKACELKNGLYCCSVCERGSLSELGAKNHFLFAHSDNVFQNQRYDSPCVLRFSNTYDFDSYRKKCKGKETLMWPKFKCFYCDNRFCTEYGLKSHEDKVHNQTPKLRKCKMCDERVPPYSMKRHLRIAHDHSRLFKCTICSKSFGKEDYMEHMLRVHKQSDILPGSKRKKIIKCHICEKSFSSLYIHNHYIRKHQRNNNNKHKNKHQYDASEKKLCPHCGKLLRKDNLTRHLFCAHPDRPRQNSCTICFRHFETKELLEAHNLEKHVRICEICGLRFRNNRGLTVHLETHLDVEQRRKWQCEACGWIGLTAAGLTLHKRTHLSEKAFKCEFCDFRYNQHPDHIGHIFKVHFGPDGFRANEKEQKENTFVCEVCMQAYPNEACLKYHLQYHQEEKPFSCILCWESFQTKYDLFRHKQDAHYVRKPPRMMMTSMRNSVRSIKFNGTDDLDSIARDPDTRGWKCQVCDKKFATITEARMHWRVKHLNETPFPCTLCGKGYKTKQDLAYHTRAVHTKEAKVVCDVCGMNFYSKSNWRVHMRTHDKKLPCSKCQTVFTSVALYRGHVKSKICH